MLVRRNFFPAPAPAFDHSLDRLFRDVFDGFAPQTEAATERGIQLNASESDEAYHVDAELPGFAEKDVEVTVIGKELRIEARQEENSEKIEGKVLRRERLSGTASRTLRFPLEIEASEVTARFENGVLNVTLPKAKAVLPRKIQIQG
ncbi:MAG: molecular chaperone Hsp20 [Gemmatimonadota bacterium]|nr:MAG: molecular chaperone Hsp20 [Gemmatimonadota bacterium]